MPEIRLPVDVFQIPNGVLLKPEQGNILFSEVTGLGAKRKLQNTSLLFVEPNTSGFDISSTIFSEIRGNIATPGGVVPRNSRNSYSMDSSMDNGRFRSVYCEEGALIRSAVERTCANRNIPVVEVPEAPFKDTKAMEAWLRANIKGTLRGRGSRDGNIRQ